jgi:hypothetical protein
MKAWERELYVSRIVAARMHLTVDDTSLIFAHPSREQRAYANEVYREALKEAEMTGVIFHSELEALMYQHNLWTEHDQAQLELLSTTLDDMKAELYDSWNQSNKRLAIRHALKKGYVERDRLENKKHALDYLTCEGIAISAKHRFLMGCSLLNGDGSPYWPHHSRWNYADSLVDKATEIVNRDRLNESQFRELAQNEPWRSYWGAKGVVGRGVLDMASVDLTDDQRALVLWSTIFDSIRESPNCPPDSIFADDDMLDGWMIIQRRRREAEMDKQAIGDKQGNSKAMNSDEVFIMAETIEDAKKIEKLNDSVGSMLKQQRMNFLKEKGEVYEIQMPDTWQRFQTAANNQALAKAKGR